MVDSHIENYLDSKDLQQPKSIKKSLSVLKVLKTYKECRKEAGPITCAIGTTAKTVTNLGVKSIGSSITAGGLASSSLGIGIPVTVAGVCVTNSADKTSDLVYENVIKTGKEYTTCRKTNNPITCGIAIGADKIFSNITNRESVGKYIKKEIINVADLADLTFNKPKNEPVKIQTNKPVKTQKNEPNGVKIIAKINNIKLLSEKKLTYSFETQQFLSNGIPKYTVQGFCDVQYLKEILKFWETFK